MVMTSLFNGDDVAASEPAVHVLVGQLRLDGCSPGPPRLPLSRSGPWGRCAMLAWAARPSDTYPSARRVRFSFSAISTSRRSASERDGASGCLSAHASTSSFSAGESRIGIVSPYLRPAGRPLFLCTLFSCFGMIFRVHRMQAGDKAATSPPALTQATEVTHGPG
jgi:hypothetical protein